MSLKDEARLRRGSLATATAFALLLLLLLPLASAATTFGLVSTAQASTIVPVTLASAGGNGCNGSCTVVLNAAGTSATIGTVNILPNPSQVRQFLKVVHGSQAWSVQVQATSATLGPGDSLVVSLVGTTTSSLTLSPATALPAASPAVQMAGGSGASDLVLNARGVCAGVCVVGLQVLLVSGTAVYTYGVTLTVT